MSDFTFNRSLGRTVEFHERVRTNDPANSALIILPLLLAGIESDAILKDYDDLATLLAGASNEATNTGYARKVITDAVLAAPTYDDTDNTVTLVIPTQTWTTIGVGGTWAKVLVCFDSDTTSGGDANITPISAHDMFDAHGDLVVPNGFDITWDPSFGYEVAS